MTTPTGPLAGRYQVIYDRRKNRTPPLPLGGSRCKQHRSRMVIRQRRDAPLYLHMPHNLSQSLLSQDGSDKRIELCSCQTMFRRDVITYVAKRMILFAALCLTLLFVHS